MNSEASEHTIIEETAEGQWIYTRRDQASHPFPTIGDAEQHELATYGSLGTATYCHVSMKGKKAVQAFLNPFN